LIPQQQLEAAHTEAERMNSAIADAADTTADLKDENTADLTATTAVIRPYASDATHDLDLAPLPRPRASGFFVFAACALVATFFTTERQPESRPKTAALFTGGPSLHVISPVPTMAAVTATDSRGKVISGEDRAAQAPELEREKPGAAVSFSALSFASPSFATSERAVAAVFVIKRTHFVKGRALVQWAVRSGSADAGIDFSDASGTARFADGQQQLAIYVPLRNDLLKEADETFRVCLRSPRHARISGRSCAEATIRDDDGVFETS
jgi:hypothetical protein